MKAFGQHIRAARFKPEANSLQVKLCCPLKAPACKILADSKATVCPAGVCGHAHDGGACTRVSRLLVKPWSPLKTDQGIGWAVGAGSGYRGVGKEENSDDVRWEAWRRARDSNQEEWINTLGWTLPPLHTHFNTYTGESAACRWSQFSINWKSHFPSHHHTPENAAASGPHNDIYSMCAKAFIIKSDSSPKSEMHRFLSNVTSERCNKMVQNSRGYIFQSERINFKSTNKKWKKSFFRVNKQLSVPTVSAGCC